MSLEDQEDHGKEVVADLWSGPIEYRVIATKGKGERLDRPELAEIEAMIRTGELDLLVCEDIGRMVRGTEAVRLCGIAVDHGTRVLAPNDCIDTADDDLGGDRHPGVPRPRRPQPPHFEANQAQDDESLPKASAAHRHARSTATSSHRVPRPTTTGTRIPPQSRFMKSGSASLRETLNCSAVADWLNEQGVPTGPYCRRKTWTGAMVRRVTRNTLLTGMPARGRTVKTKHYETGKRIPVKNPKGPKYRECPHLKFWEPREVDELNAALDEKNKGFGHKRVNGRDPRWRVPRRRTRFPAQHAQCWYCGHTYVWGGNGVAKNLMCANSRQCGCWNSFGFEGSLAVGKLVEAITTELYQLEGFDDQFRQLVAQAGQEGGTSISQRWERLNQAVATNALEKENFRAAIAKYGPRPMFDDDLAKIEATERRLGQERRELEKLTNRTLRLPGSIAQLRQEFEQQFEKLTAESPEFGA